MTIRRSAKDERGFTLVEVMVAVTLLIVGVLGVVTMVTGANAQTAVTKSREGATNLSREIVDAARGVDYDSLTSSGIVTALQLQPGLADSDTTLAGWQLSRRGIVYTVASLPVCIVDAEADHYGAHPTPTDPAAPAYCSGQSTDTKDANPDDFRRVDVTITWTTENHNYSLRETTLIINPSGGIGPTVKSLCRTVTATDAACPTGASAPTNVVSQVTPQSAQIKTVNFLALTSVADLTTWTRDDGSVPVDITGSNPAATSGFGTAWNYTWNLGDPVAEDAYTCGMATPWTLDGNYVVSAQAVSGIGASGVPGQLKPYTLTINRDRPYKICGLNGGYNQMTAPQPAGHPTGVDFEWNLNQERDVIGYRIYRVNGATPSGDSLVCDTVGVTDYPVNLGGCVCNSRTSCVDTNPKNTNSPVTYRVTAVDRDDLGGVRDSNPADQSTITIDQGPDSAPAFGPGSVTETISGGQPVISWPAATDSDGTIRYYRIYRNGEGYMDRYDQVSGTRTSYVDQNPSPGGDTYWVTAVDDRYDESQPVPATVGP